MLFKIKKVKHKTYCKYQTIDHIERCMPLVSNQHNKSLGELIKKLRHEKGYSQRKFAQISGLSNTTISRIESGETLSPDIDTLRLLARHLDYDEERLVSMLNSHQEIQKSHRQAKLKFLQQPVKMINRYSTVSTIAADEMDNRRAEVQEKVESPVEPVQLEPALECPEEQIPIEKVPIKGMRLITLRLEKKVTQKELADKLGIEKSMIAQYEAETLEPDYSIVKSMADYFSVEMDYLTGNRAKLVEETFVPLENVTKHLIPVPVVHLEHTAPVEVSPPLEYMEIAKEIYAAGIDLQDLRVFIDMLKRYKAMH